MEPEMRARISAALKGRHLSPEHRAKLSLAGMGKHPTPEARAKMSLTAIGNKHGVGHIVSLETRAKMSAAHIGKPSNRKDTHLSDRTKAKISAAQWEGGPAIWIRKANAKRRTLGFVPLNEPFPSCEAHHVDNEQVINMPKALHRSIYHRQDTGQGMAKINAVAYNFLFKQEVEAAMSARGCAHAK